MLVYENQTSKIKFLVSRSFFAEILISKMGVKMNLRIITKNHAADPKIGFLIKSISKPNGRATAMPTAWELILDRLSQNLKIIAYDFECVGYPRNFLFIKFNL